MILDNLSTSHCEYGNMDGRLARAFDWLRSHDLTTLAPGQTIHIEGSRIYAMIQAHTTVPADQGTFEAHRAYIDIQYMVKGAEIMQWCPLSRLTNIKVPYDFEKDIIRYEDPAICVPILVEEGSFAVFFPTDGHKPKCLVKEAAQTQKIVVKVAV